MHKKSVLGGQLTATKALPKSYMTIDTNSQTRSSVIQKLSPKATFTSGFTGSLLLSSHKNGWVNPIQTSSGHSNISSMSPTNRKIRGRPLREI